MSIQNENQKLYIRSIILIAMFLIAGLCQYFDARVPEIGEYFLCNIANCLYFFILITWYISIKEKIVEKRIRKYLSFVSLSLLFLMATRFVKYNFFQDYGFILRFLWYIYYIPECLAPIFMFLIALQVDRKENSGLKIQWHILFIPAVIFIAFVLTNDFHQFCFKFKPNFENFDSDYKHGIVFYLMLTYNLLISIMATVVLFYKCRVSAVKKRIWIPITLFTLASAFTLIAFLMNIDSYKIPELLCLIVILLMESMIYIGFIPSNYNYKKYFLLSNTNALIADSNLKVFAYSNNSNDVFNCKLEKIKEQKVVTIDDMKYRSKEINGGYVFWIENLATINYLNNEIQEIMNQLSGENDLLYAKNKLKEERAKINEQHKLYQMIENVTKKEVKEVNNMLFTYSQHSIENDLKLACIYAAYIKRRSNLLILHEKDNMVHVDELTFAIKESITYLSLYGVSCSFLNLKKDRYFNIEIIELVYDFFQEVIEKALPSLNALIVRFSEKNDKLIVRICLGSPQGFIGPNWNKSKLSKYNGEIQLFTESEDHDYIVLTLEVK